MEIVWKDLPGALWWGRPAVWTYGQAGSLGTPHHHTLSRPALINSNDGNILYLCFPK